MICRMLCSSRSERSATVRKVYCGLLHSTTSATGSAVLRSEDHACPLYGPGLGRDCNLLLPLPPHQSLLLHRLCSRPLNDETGFPSFHVFLS